MMTERTKGILAYLLGPIGGLIFLYYAQGTSRETRVNAAQSILMGVAFILVLVVVTVFSLLMGIRIFVTIISLIYFVLTFLGCMNAYNEKEFNIPIVTENALKIFANKIDQN